MHDIRCERRLEREDGVLYLSIHRNSKLFCQECFLYVTVETKKPAQAPMYLSAQWLVDRDIIYLKNNEEVESTVEPDSHGQHFIIDLRELEYDSDVYIGIHKLNEPNTSLTVDLSLTVLSWMVCELVLRRRRVGHREVDGGGQHVAARVGRAP